MRLTNSMQCKPYSVLLHTLMDKYELAKQFIESDNHTSFKLWLETFSKKFPDRGEIIEEGSKYILDNWVSLQRLLKTNASCSMEGCISHSLANDLKDLVSLY